MTDAPKTPPAATPPAVPAAPAAPAPAASNGQPPAAPAAGDQGATAAARDTPSTIGTVLMAVAITATVVVLLDIALKGRLLGPLFAVLMPKGGPAPGDPAPEDG